MKICHISGSRSNISFINYQLCSSSPSRCCFSAGPQRSKDKCPTKLACASGFSPCNFINSGWNLSVCAAAIYKVTLKSLTSHVGSGIFGGASWEGDAEMAGSFAMSPQGGIKVLKTPNRVPKGVLSSDVPTNHALEWRLQGNGTRPCQCNTSMLTLLETNVTFPMVGRTAATIPACKRRSELLPHHPAPCPEAKIIMQWADF